MKIEKVWYEAAAREIYKELKIKKDVKRTD